jgi:hypothetical protein
MPSKCPICNKPMMNSYKLLVDGTEQLILKCNGISHMIRFYSSTHDHDEVTWVSLLANNKVIDWEPSIKRLGVSDVKDENEIVIPYFEPDFSDYKKLLSKIKTYLVFS